MWFRHILRTAGSVYKAVLQRLNLSFRSETRWSIVGKLDMFEGCRSDNPVAFFLYKNKEENQIGALSFFAAFLEVLNVLENCTFIQRHTNFAPGIHRNNKLKS